MATAGVVALLLALAMSAAKAWIGVVQASSSPFRGWMLGRLAFLHSSLRLEKEALYRHPVLSQRESFLRLPGCKADGEVSVSPADS